MLADADLSTIAALIGESPPSPLSAGAARWRGAVRRRARAARRRIVLAGEQPPRVGLTDALVRQGVMRESDAGFEITARGERRLRELGVDITAARSQRRAFTRRCLDWTERRPHVAGSLGAALADRLFELGWLRRMPGTRALAVTPEGERQLLSQFALQL